MTGVNKLRMMSIRPTKYKIIAEEERQLLPQLKVVHYNESRKGIGFIDTTVDSGQLIGVQETTIDSGQLIGVQKAHQMIRHGGSVGFRF